MDMVDNALERPDVALSKRGAFGLRRFQLLDVRNVLPTSFFGAESFFEKKSVRWNIDRHD